MDNTFDNNATNNDSKESPFANSPYETSWQPQADAGAYASQTPPVPPTFPSQEPKKSKSSGKAWKTTAAVGLAVVLLAGGCGGTAALVNHHWEEKTNAMNAQYEKKFEEIQNQISKGSSQSATPGSTVSSVSQGAMTPGQVYAENVEGVVAISNQAVTTNIFGQVSETASSGSGFIISEDGYVISNYHVVEGATKLTVITYDTKEYEAKVVGFDAGNDVALLKIEAKGLHPVKIGSSDSLIVGDQVAAIGNPLGELTSSLTVGYVSAKDRTINTEGSFINMIQIDAAINPGNSGGPLFNMKGEVIGINTAKYSGATGSGATIEGIGFAIPIDDVMDIVNDLKEFGYVNSAYLGVSVMGVDDQTSALYGLPHGSLIQSVVDGSCADKAGLKQQDIIVKLGDYEIASNTDLTRALRRFKAGDETVVTVYRAGQNVELSIVLDEKPAPAEMSEPGEKPAARPEGEVPSDGNFDEWYEYFSPFFGG